MTGNNDTAKSNNDINSLRLEGRDCVPFFRSDKNQIIFEFFYLIVIFIFACVTLFSIQIFGIIPSLSQASKVAIYSVIGGFLGGWVYDAKWFYRVTARGKNNQYSFPWQPHKFYWRILTPFLSSMVAFSTFLLGTSEIIPISIKNKESAATAFSLSFLIGYFSDLVLSRLAAWAERIIPKVKKDE